MKWIAIPGALLALAFSTAGVRAQDVSGTWMWQGPDWQRVLKISKAPDGSLSGRLYNVGKDRDIGPLLLSPIALTGSNFMFEDWSANYKGTISKDGKSIIGTLDQGGPPQLVTFVRSSNNLPIDPSPHRVKLITVEKGVSLEVLDWGGNGPPLVLLAGNFNTAHVYDGFAERFTAKHHVYGITRRGFGISSTPPLSRENYDSDRRGDDILTVMDTLKIEKPILAGHSIAGQELSSIGTRHPEKVSGLIYLDSGYSYGLYESKPTAAISTDTAIAARDLDELWATEPSARGPIIQELQDILPNLQRGLEWAMAELPGESDWLANRSPQTHAGDLIVEAGRKYTGVKPPILAIYASPHQCQPNCDKVKPTSYEASWPAQIDAVQADYPDARIIKIPYANHTLWRTNAADVEQAMNVFMDEHD